MNRLLLYRVLYGLGALTVLASTSACSKAPYVDYSKVELVSAHGVVTLDQQPLSQATIVFEGQDKQYSFATTDADGRYALKYDSVQSGVTPGQKVVRITTGAGAAGEEAEMVNEGQAAASPAPVERIPARYNRQSELSVNVTAGQTEYNFDLKSNSMGN